MQMVSPMYNEQEKAWFFPFNNITEDIFLIIELEKAGRIVIRQKDNASGENPTVPISCKKNTDRYELRLLLRGTKKADISVFMSEKPKFIGYEYISTRRNSGQESATDEDGRLQ